MSAANIAHHDAPFASESISVNSVEHSAPVVDTRCSLSGARVYLDYDCLLNQTNIGGNNNKFYVIQLLEVQDNYYVWKRWGRVGESGQNTLVGPTSLFNAIKDFKMKFREKTKNHWDDRNQFITYPGKFSLLQLDLAPSITATRNIDDLATSMATTSIEANFAENGIETSLSVAEDQISC
eukprot:c233_g1_i1.p1 GENE.c233_g1_i1~~c233_g1_i1.p1  ORF type:complete len:196 (+),score=43.41 c233_g1_i1:50-589(+)